MTQVIRLVRSSAAVVTAACVTAVIVLAGAVPAGAQDGGPDPSKVRVRIGPLWMNPTIALSNLGVDQNVFNDAPDQAPKKDITATLEPNTDLWLRLGRTWLTATLKEQIVWYVKYASERSVNNAFTLGWRVPLTRLIFNTAVIVTTTRERTGYEIDARTPRNDKTYNGSVEFRGLPKTFFGVRGEHMTSLFDDTAVFKNVDLHTELSHSTTSGGLFIRHQLTPLTAFAVAASHSEDRFQFDPLRNSTSTIVTASVNFDPFALIRGSATVGYRKFQPADPGLAGYQGATFGADLGYTIQGSTKIALKALRDVQYSYDANQPYYLQTGGDVSIAQQIFGPFDGEGRLGAQQLAYQTLDRAAMALTLINRVDRVRSYGAGIGYHMGKDLRLGVNVDKIKRLSDIKDHNFDNIKFGTAVTYLF